jgi:transposase InsO family protein
VYFLKFKSEVFATFKTLKDFFQKNSSHYIKNLHTSNRHDYVSHTFKYFCREHVILHQHFVPYTPQQNGVVESKNMTLKEMEKCMI